MKNSADQFQPYMTEDARNAVYWHQRASFWADRALTAEDALRQRTAALELEEARTAKLEAALDTSTAENARLIREGTRRMKWIMEAIKSAQSLGEDYSREWFKPEEILF